MQQELITYQTYASPRKTGGLIAGITLVTLGIGALVLYLVKQSRKADEEALRKLMEGEPVEVYQPKATTIGGLLDELTQFGRPESGSSTNGTSSTQNTEYTGSGTTAPTMVADDVGCAWFTTERDIIEDKADNTQINSCGIGVYEFQMYLNDLGFSTPVTGRYSQKTLKAHRAWLDSIT
tara:strand:- start:2710 stop:3246 length:537 start_codon:yes stop_codon:yes gene_type:complete